MESPSFSKRGEREGVGEGEGRRGRKGGKWGRPPSPIRFGLGGRAPCLVLPPLFHHLAHEAQYLFPRIPVTPGYSEKYPNHSEPFRCPNIVVQYIDLYVSTISRLLVMSPISTGTPNYLRYIKSHKLIIPIVTERQACGPYGFDNYVDMNETRLRSITNSGTWMLILVIDRRHVLVMST